MTSGYLSLITGPMGAGKSTKAARVFSNYGLNKKNLLCIVHNPLDTRAKMANCVWTHCGELEVKATYIRGADLTAVDIPAGTTHVFLDEVQFFDAKQLEAVVVEKWIKQQHLFVLCAGLLTDKNMDFWPATLIVLKYADEHRALSSTCKCGCPAGHTKVKAGVASSSAQVVVGGMDTYEAVCVNCHK